MPQLVYPTRPRTCNACKRKKYRLACQSTHCYLIAIGYYHIYKNAIRGILPAYSCWCTLWTCRSLFYMMSDLLNCQSVSERSDNFEKVPPKELSQEWTRPYGGPPKPVTGSKDPSQFFHCRQQASKTRKQFHLEVPPRFKRPKKGQLALRVRCEDQLRTLPSDSQRFARDERVQIDPDKKAKITTTFIKRVLYFLQMMNKESMQNDFFSFPFLSEDISWNRLNGKSPAFKAKTLTSSRLTYEYQHH